MVVAVVMVVVIVIIIGRNFRNRPQQTASAETNMSTGVSERVRLETGGEKFLGYKLQLT